MRATGLVPVQRLAAMETVSGGAGVTSAAALLLDLHEVICTATLATTYPFHGSHAWSRSDSSNLSGSLPTKWPYMEFTT